MTMVPEPAPWGERIRPSNRSAMNSRLSKWMVPLREETLCGRCSAPVVVMNADDGTIRIFGGNARYKSPYLVHHQLVFFAPARYRVALQTTKHTSLS
jgi:uncharacterized protein YfaQ (DUF2300 family)